MVWLYIGAAFVAFMVLAYALDYSGRRWPRLELFGIAIGMLGAIGYLVAIAFLAYSRPGIGWRLFALSWLLSLFGFLLNGRLYDEARERHIKIAEVGRERRDLLAALRRYNRNPQ